MSQDVIHCQEQLSVDEIMKTLGAQIFDFSGQDLFQETQIQNSDAISGTAETTNSNNQNDDVSILFGSQNDIPFDFDISTNILNDPFAIDSPAGKARFISPNPLTRSPDFKENCLPSVPSYRLGLNTNSAPYSVFGPTGLPAESSGIFWGNFLPRSQQFRQLEYQGETRGVFRNSIQQSFAPGNFLKKALADGGVSGESQNQPAVVAAAASPLFAAEITELDGGFGKLSVEQRKEKIQKYKKKRNQRNFTKKIKYACRKTLADSRPRVRGRFAKSNKFGEAHRQPSSRNYDEDDYDYVFFKEDESEMGDSSDILEHVSRVN